MLETLPHGILLDDLISAGKTGLLAVMNDFDSLLSVELTTYSEYRIKGTILDFLRKLDWAVSRRSSVVQPTNAYPVARGDLEAHSLGKLAGVKCLERSASFLRSVAFLIRKAAK